MGNESESEARFPTPVQSPSQAGRSFNWWIAFSPLLVVLPLAGGFILWGAHVLSSYNSLATDFPWTAITTLIGVAGAITAALITFRWQSEQQRLQREQLEESRRQFEERQTVEQDRFLTQLKDSQGWSERKEKV